MVMKTNIKVEQLLPCTDRDAESQGRLNGRQQGCFQLWHLKIWQFAVILLTYHNKGCDELICPLYFSQDTQSHLESVRNSKISTEKDCSFFQPNSLKNKIHQFILNQIDPLCNKKHRICMGMGGDCTHPFSHLGHGSGCREQRLEVLGPEIMLHVSRVTLCLSHYTFS